MRVVAFHTVVHLSLERPPPVNNQYFSSKSRRKTPWDALSCDDMTPSQQFIKFHHVKHYDERHEPLGSTGEASVINSHSVAVCPFCGSDQFVRNGFSDNGIQQYRCKDCHRKFSPTTGTIYDNHKLSISDWIDFLYNLFAYVSLSSDSWNNRNSFTTTRYWLEKVFLILDEYQKGIVLKGNVILDETFYPVRISDMELNEDGSKPRGLSRNQICIGVACDDIHVYCVLEGFGKPSQKKTYEAFKDHIEPGSTLIHDMDNSHQKLIRKLGLKEKAYDSKTIKKLPDKLNPLNKVNTIHSRIKKFFYAHNSFNRASIKGYIDLFSFMMNPPADKFEKIDILLNLGFQISKLLRYRDFYSD